jgi:hypothetical protein
MDWQTDEFKSTLNRLYDILDEYYAWKKDKTGSKAGTSNYNKYDQVSSIGWNDIRPEINTHPTWRYDDSR